MSWGAIGSATVMTVGGMMSDDGDGGGGGGPSVSYTSTMLPQDAERWETIADEGMDIAFKDPLLQYGVDPETNILDVDKRIAPFDPLQEESFGLRTDWGRGTSADLEESRRQLGLAATLPEHMKSSYRAGKFGIEDLTPEMYESLGNPYTENVVDNVLRRMEEDRSRAAQGTAAERVGRGGDYGLTPYGSGRANLANVLAMSEHGRNVKEASTELYSARHGDIVNRYQWAQERLLEAQELGDNAAAKQAELELEALRDQFEATRDVSSDYRDLSNVADKRQLAQFGALEEVGAKKQAMAQGIADLQTSLFDERFNYPREMTQWISDLIRGKPSGVEYESTADPSKYGDMIGLYGAGKGIGSYRDLLD